MSKEPEAKHPPRGTAQEYAILLETHRRQTQAVLESLTEGVLVVDTQGRIVTWNSAAMRHLNMSAEDVASFSRGDGVLATPILREALSDRRRRRGTVGFERRQPRPFDLPYEKEVFLAIPSRRTLRITSAPFINPEGAVEGRVFTIRDVTREKRIEELKDNFVALVSHELRTPMTSILGFASLALSRRIGTLNDRQRKALRSVYRQAKRLDGLIAQLLDLSRIERKVFVLKISEVLFDEIVENVVEELTIQAQQKDVTIDLRRRDPLPKVRADKDRIVQLLTILLDNAIKFSPAGESVEVEISANDGRVRVAVIDHGPGIPEETLTRVFDKFYRGQNLDPSPGLGLGLPIAVGIVRAHGGEIAVETEPGRGAMFWFAIPVAGPEESAE